MTVTLTTRRLLHMLKEVYKIGALKEAVRNPQEENLEGTAETEAQKILNKYQWQDDFINQQT